MRSLTPAQAGDARRPQFLADGYLYLPKLLNTEQLAAASSDLRTALYGAGWLANRESLTLSQSVLSEEGANHLDVYPVIQRLESVHALALSDEIVEIVSMLLNTVEIFTHPAKAVRVGLPTDTYFTKPHQDLSRLLVTADVLTAWVCFTPCKRDKEGLRVIPGSHRWGFLAPDDPDFNSAPIYLSIPLTDARWATADFEPGDVVIFHSLTVHAGGPNTTDSLRLSADYRYQRAVDPIMREWTLPHGSSTVGSWAGVAEGWSSHAAIETPPRTPVVEAHFTDKIDLATFEAPPSPLLG